MWEKTCSKSIQNCKNISFLLLSSLTLQKLRCAVVLSRAETGSAYALSLLLTCLLLALPASAGLAASSVQDGFLAVAAPPLQPNGSGTTFLCQNIFASNPDQLCAFQIKEMSAADIQAFVAFLRQVFLMISPYPGLFPLVKCLLSFLYFRFFFSPNSSAFLSCARKLLISIAKKQNCNPGSMPTPNNLLCCSCVPRFGRVYL